MAEIHLTIFGPPVPKARARTWRDPKGGYHSKTPTPTAMAEEAFKAAFIGSGQEPIPRGASLVVYLTCYFDRPPSVPKKRRYPNVNPDYDNLAKLVTDALQKLAFYNDSEIVHATIRKRYVTYPDPTRTVVRIRTLT